MGSRVLERAPISKPRDWTRQLGNLCLDFDNPKAVSTPPLGSTHQTHPALYSATSLHGRVEQAAALSSCSYV